ncbi:MAG: hypothetical protein LBH06_05890 [Rikenellaceae bacterium]|jgi:hypothetical protein|nr:hypothetical protein [Rikenellaceae bacterium]
MTGIEEYINDKWECCLCGREKPFELLPTGYLGNYHPLCERCADGVLTDKDNKHHYRLMYHENTGDIAFC